MRHAAALALVAATAVVTLAGCGSSDSSVATEPGVSPTSTAPTSTTPVPTTATPTTGRPDTSTSTSTSTSTTVDVAGQPEVTPGTYHLRVDPPTPVGGGATLRLVDVNDSRCPDDVMCAWEGELTAQVVWAAPGVDTTLDLTWAYHADPTPIPGTDLTLALDDATVDGTGAGTVDGAVATVRII